MTSVIQKVAERSAAMQKTATCEVRDAATAAEKPVPIAAALTVTPHALIVTK
ncbi:MAG: hypothetical protein M3461_13510 [Pseudomonadota bacterium]|nr:hypothetical protein [Pseudomonadota bacterium]